MLMLRLGVEGCLAACQSEEWLGHSVCLIKRQTGC